MFAAPNTLLPRCTRSRGPQHLPILSLDAASKRILLLTFDRASASIPVVDHPNGITFNQFMMYAKSALKSPDIQIVPLRV